MSALSKFFALTALTVRLIREINDRRRAAGWYL